MKRLSVMITLWIAVLVVFSPAFGQTSQPIRVGNTPVPFYAPAAAATVIITQNAGTSIAYVVFNVNRQQIAMVSAGTSYTLTAPPGTAFNAGQALGFLSIATNATGITFTVSASAVLPIRQDLFTLQAAAPATPNAGYLVLYGLTSTKGLYIKDSTGAVTGPLGTGGGGGPCTVKASSYQYDNSGSLGCVTDVTYDGSHTTTIGAAGIYTFTSGATVNGLSTTVNGQTCTIQSTCTVAAAAGTLTGTALNSTVVTSSLTSVGTIVAGVWTGTAIAIADGGTNATSAAAGTVPNATSSSAASWTSTVTLGVSGTAGTLALFPASGNFTTTLGSAATASSIFLFPVAVPTTNHSLICVVSAVTCTLTDIGFAYTAYPAADIAAGALASGMTATTQSGGDDSTKVATTAYVDTATDLKTTRTVSQQFGTPGGSAISTGVLGYVRMPYACTGLGSWSITVDAGTDTVKTWKVAAGTAIPTTGNSISTSGVAISSGTNVTSTTVTDFTTATTTAGDIFGFDLSATSGTGFITFELVYTGCTQ